VLARRPGPALGDQQRPLAECRMKTSADTEFFAGRPAHRCDGWFGVDVAAGEDPGGDRRASSDREGYASELFRESPQALLDGLVVGFGAGTDELGISASLGETARSVVLAAAYSRVGRCPQRR
jgi:hypothetical protein